MWILINCVSLIFINLNLKKIYIFFAVLRRGKCRSSSGKLVKACRNLSSSESTRAFPVCSVQLAASSCSSPPSLPPSPSQSHLSSISLPPLNLSDAAGRDLALLPLWWFFLSFPVLLAMFYFFDLLLPCTGVSSLCSIYMAARECIDLTFPCCCSLRATWQKPLRFVSVILIWYLHHFYLYNIKYKL